jgi:CHAT domain
MLTLRLTQYADNQPDCYRVEVALEGDGPRQTATVRFQFALTQQEQENIRWYLEDYLQYLSDPAPQIAAKVEKRMAEIGIELFKAIFQANEDVRDLWATLRQNLNHTRVEILTDIAQAAVIPWELLRDPKTDTCLALRSPAFVRSYSQAAQRPKLPQTNGDAIRILLVICRPGGRADVPFRSVASRLIKGLGNRANCFQLDVLRPPTFEQLSRILRQAKAQGKPYHVVHFDGHGIYQNGCQLALNGNPLVFADRRPGMHGYLAFENGLADDNVEFVSGPDLGRLLVETDVSVLVLNACRSAHAEAQDAPMQVNDTASDKTDDPHSQVRALGSLAQEVMDAGVAGVAAMRYNVYVMTAAQFVADLYTSLVQGQTLGEAVTSGRKQLNDQPQREIAYQPVALQDWLVPVVYEAAPIALFPTSTHAPTLTITLHENDALPTTGMLDAQLPKPPDVGFFGRDETLLAIDRAFDHHAIVLLHAFAGSGKTSAAAEFGRWYALTGGLLEAGRQGYVLFTSFQRYLPLPRVLDKLGQMFERDLARSGIQWLALNDDQRRAVALQVLSQVPVLWIWDNVEPVAGFPDGETQCWREAEQQELADFLRDARTTKAKFLLTSRRDERGWLGDLPVRVQVPPMPMWERVQFARELAKKHGYRLTDVGNWFPLLRYTQGNPLTITVVISQALRNGYRSKEQIEKFVSELRSGEAELDDDESEGRSKSLSASLSYGFIHTFDEKELEHLALLYLFQGFVDSRIMCWMGKPEEDWCLSSVCRLKYDYWNTLLGRVCEIGLLTKLGESFYSIHPAVPWHFKKLFNQFYPKLHSFQATISAEHAIHAFVESMAFWANLYHSEYGDGNRNVIYVLVEEEPNLLYARQLARKNGWWKAALQLMQGLHVLYGQTGRHSEWSRLVEEIVPDFIDTITKKPKPGREEFWIFINSYLVLLAEEKHQYEEAKHLQKECIDLERQRISHYLNSSSENLDFTKQVAIRRLTVAIEELGQISYSQSLPDCIEYYEEAMHLYQRINDQPAQANLALSMGTAYCNLRDIQNLEKATFWYHHSLKLRTKNDYQGHGQCYAQLGLVSLEYFKKAHADGQDEELLIQYLRSAEKQYSAALKLIPQTAIGDLSVVHSQLGIVYHFLKDISLALYHYRRAVSYEEQQDNFYGAGSTRYNIARMLCDVLQFDDALLYAHAALQNFEAYGDRAMDVIQKTQRLIGQIRQNVSEI